MTSIISAFGSGLDIFQRLTRKKRKTNARPPRPSEEEEWLRQSLNNRPAEIRHEYDQQVAKFGRHFEHGDGAAQSSLAHTLLVLNTGLINLINHALSGNAKNVSSSQKALYSLSETAAVDTMAALVQLGSRLNLASASRLAIEPKEPKVLNEKPNRKAPQSASPTTSKQKQRPPPTPLLVRGGWVRPTKSGSSVVPGPSAGKGRAPTTDKHRRAKSDSIAVKASSRSTPTKVTKREDLATSSPSVVNDPNERNMVSARAKSEEHLRLHRQPSMFLVPAEFFDSTELQVEPPLYVEAPPRPPKIPLHSRPQQPHRRTRPVSTMTFMTTSTKVGEIPESRFQTQEDIGLRPLPYTIPPPLEPVEPKKRKGFKFWKREDKRQDIAAF